MKLFGTPPVVYLDRQQIVVGSVKRGVVTTEVILDKPWDEANLITATKSIRKRFGKKILLLIGEDLSYVLYQKLPDKKQSTADQVKDLIQQQIPEDIAQLHWGYQLIDSNKGETMVQVTAFVTQFVKHLQVALEEAELQIEQVEPLSIALASQLVDSAEPRLLFYQGLQNLALVVHNRAVVACETLEDFSESNIKTFLRFITEEKAVQPQGIMVVGNPKLSSDVAVKQVKLDPFISTTRDYQEKRQKIKIDLTATEKTSQPQAGDVDEKKSDTSQRRVYILLGILLLLAGIVGALLYTKGYFKLGNQATDSQLQESPATVQDTAPSVPSSSSAVIAPTPIPLAEYSVQILNGSGQAGQAGSVQELLIAEGFNEVVTGNADRFDYTTTVVQLKAGTPILVYDELERALNSEYVLELQEERLDTDLEYDLQVIVGSLKPEIE